MENWNKVLDGEWKLGICEDKDLNYNEIPVCLCEVRNQKFLIIDACVPGNFELDMQKAGLLPDLFFGKNLKKAQELEMIHLFYSKKFELSLEEMKSPLEVIFEGIDTVSEIYLNGFLIGKTDNMFISHEFPMKYLYEGENEIFVHIYPPALKIRDQEGEMLYQASWYHYDSLCIRKSCFMWGWDIFPRILSGGIWRSCFIRQVKEFAITQCYLMTDQLAEDYSSADLKLWFDTRIGRLDTRELSILLEGKCGESTFVSRQRIWSKMGKLSINLKEPLLWWPAGSGQQNLYQVRVRLLRGEEVLDEKHFKFGIRTVELKKTSVVDEEGNGEFLFIVNHRRLFVKGTNWVPLSSFPSRGKERISQALALVEDIGCNMIRCWGGGYYEDDLFYELCDEKGFLVWQDFMMACGYYPQNEAFCKEIEKEAVSVVKRLRQHPCLALWAGDNECDEFLKNQTGGFTRNPNENVLTRKVIREVVRRHDGIRPYLPSSPYVDEEAYAKGKLRYLPENHLWGPRDYFKSDFYAKSPACFASETGYHGCPSVSSIKKFISQEALWPYWGNGEWILHASAREDREDAPDAYRIPLMANQIRVLFGLIPDTLEEFALLSQISQGEAMKFFVERFRMGKWGKSGIIWWNILDGCPQFSDAVVDYYFKKKLAYFYIRRSQNQVCLMIGEKEEERYGLFGVNDRAEDVNVSFMVRDVLMDKLLLEGEALFLADSSVRLADITLTEEESRKGGFLQIVWQGKGIRGENHYAAWEVPWKMEKYLKAAEKIGLLRQEGKEKY